MVHLLILGGSGRTGKYGVKYALEKGYTVTAIVRNTSSLEAHANLNIVTGSVSKRAIVDLAVSSGAPIDGVAVFLNANRTSDAPWSKLAVPPRFITGAVENVAAALKNHYPENNTRLVVLSALGVGDSFQITPWFLRLMISNTNLGASYADHNALDSEITTISGNAIDWILVRAVMLGKSGMKPVRIFGGNQSGAGLSITRESCANWMIDVAAGVLGSEYSNRAIIVSN